MTDAQAPVPQKKSRSVLSTILIILGVMFALGTLGMGACVYLVFQNPEIRDATALLGEAVNAGLAATKAPGTEELRQAGCTDAAVMDMSRMTALMEKLDAEGPSGVEVHGLPPPELRNLVMVSCSTTREPPLACEQIAKVYAGAVPTHPERFGVVVTRASGAAEELCEGLYNSTGERLGSAKPPEPQAQEVPSEITPELDAPASPPSKKKGGSFKLAPKKSTKLPTE